jgi:hypothetical protein
MTDTLVWETESLVRPHPDAPAFIEVTGTSGSAACGAPQHHGDDVTLTLELIPRIAGVAEAAEIMGWDKRRVVGVDRDSSPTPDHARVRPDLAREDIEAYAEEWRRGHPRPGGASG